MVLENNSEIIYFQWSQQVIVITTIISIIFLVSFFAIVKYTPFIYIKIPVIALISILSLFFIAKTPIKLIINKDEICIKHVLSKTYIRIDDIIDVQRVQPSVIIQSERDFGSSGFCGFLGRFSSKDIGKYKLYATELNNLILIKMEDEQYILSCRDFSKIKSLLKHRNRATKK